MKRRVLPALAILLLTGALVLQPAGASEDEREIDTSWLEERRQLSLDISTARDRAEFTSQRNSELGEDTVNVHYDRDTGRLEYRFTSFDAEGEGIRLSYDWQLVGLVEFRDPSGEGHYGLDSQVVERYDLNTMNAQGLTQTGLIPNGNQIIAEYTIPGRGEHDDGPLGETTRLSDGTLQLILTMTERPQQVEGQQAMPTEIHVHLNIEDHPFTEDDTLLAAEFRVSGNPGPDMGQDQLLQNRGSFESYAQWDPDARIDGALQPVQTTALAFPGNGNEGAFVLVSAYPQGDTISQGWTMGTLQYERIPEQIVEVLTRGNALIYGLALVATLVLAGLPVARRLNRG